MQAVDGLRGAAAAVAFLTRLPIGRLVVLDERDVSRGAALFPLVGAAIGAVVGGTAAGLVEVLPPIAAAGIALAVGAVLTGALHLDGLADTADALGAATRERALEIMRDHTTGAFGATALALDLIVKAAVLAALAEDGSALGFAIAAGALARSGPVVLAAWLPSARGEGAGAGFAVAKGAAVAAVVLGVAAGSASAGLDGLVLAAAAVVVALVLGAAFLRWLGGVTGDTLGATAELTETLALVTAAILVGT
jgi:adenosylcobinamide-GDP ribazoletransferase